MLNCTINGKKSTECKSWPLVLTTLVIQQR